MNPRVKKVTPQPDYKLEIVFSNNEQGIFDCSHLLEFGVFHELKDVNYFNKAMVCDGTVVWPNDQDICPDTLYIDAVKRAATKVAPPS
ncbi:DUF2442 domain-containing protein [Planctomycetota bacterium]